MENSKLSNWPQLQNLRFVFSYQILHLPYNPSNPCYNLARGKFVLSSKTMNVKGFTLKSNAVTEKSDIAPNSNFMEK